MHDQFCLNFLVCVKDQCSLVFILHSYIHFFQVFLSLLNDFTALSKTSGAHICPRISLGSIVFH